jgi:hypothetical protein
MSVGRTARPAAPEIAQTGLDFYCAGGALALGVLAPTDCETTDGAEDDCWARSDRSAFCALFL